MNDKILKFIHEEKKFSKFKIQTLERTSSPHKLRLIKKERDFSSFPFEDMNFETIEDCRDALDLFRVSKSSFLKKFSEKKYEDIFKSQCDFVLSKIKDIRIDDVGIIDGHMFKSLSESEIFKVDGSIRSKYQKFLSLCKEMLLLIYRYSISNGKIPEKIEEVFDIIPENKDSCKVICSGIEEMRSSDFSSIIHKTENTSLIATTLPHKSNEKTNMIYSRLFDNEMNRIYPERQKFVSVSIDGEYFKSISVKKSESEDIDFDKSYIGVSKSRRFSEQFAEIKVWAKIILAEIKEI